MNWRKLLGLRKYDEEPEAEAIMNAFQRYPWLDVVANLCLLLDFLSVVLMVIGHREAFIAMATAGCANAINGGLMWHVGIRKWAILDLLIGCVFAIVAVLISAPNTVS